MHVAQCVGLYGGTWRYLSATTSRPGHDLRGSEIVTARWSGQIASGTYIRYQCWLGNPPYVSRGL